MKKTVLILMAMLVGLGVSCVKKTERSAKTEILSREAFVDSISQPGVQLADIRTAEEHAEEGNFDNAVNIDFVEEDFYKLMEEHFDKSKPLYIHCKGGLKSHKATMELLDMGFEEVYELQGGFDDWTEEMQEAKRQEMKNNN